MFQTLFELGKTCALGFLLNEYVKRQYPDDYENFVIIASYKFFYFYSQAEIFIKKTTKYITEKYPTLILVIDDLNKFFRRNKKNHSDIEPIIVIQKCTYPKRVFIILPNIFGNQ